jgi:hypothetical protein
MAGELRQRIITASGLLAAASVSTHLEPVDLEAVLRGVHTMQADALASCERICSLLGVPAQ